MTDILEQARRLMSGNLASRLILAAATLVGLGVLAILVLWYAVRVEVNANECLVLVNKTGRPIPADLGDEFRDQVVLYPALLEKLAEREGVNIPASGKERDEAMQRIARRYKGIQYTELKEGRYFPNPYSYKRIKIAVTVISQNEVGVLIRKYGRPLKFPKTVATEPDERGPVAEILRPDRYYVNTLAYDVQKFPAVHIPEGHVGVVTLLSGDEPKVKNTYTVQPGEQGVQKRTLRPGLEYYNPYLKNIDIVDIRNRTRHMLGSDAINFPSNDSFTIAIEGTIEWSIDPDRVAEVTVAYGDEQDVIDKIILPYARSISRIEGSKLQAREFISGRTRTAFQARFFEELESACAAQGIIIHSALVREIIPPPEIASLISLREQADQEIDRSRNQIEEAQAESGLVEQKEMQTRNAALGDAKRQTVSLTKEAEQRKIIAVTQAQRQYEVGLLELEAATKEAAALVARGRAEANVVLFEFQARAEPLKNAVDAFGDGMTYAQHFFYQKVAPAMQTILSNTEGPFADVFKSFQQFKTPGKSIADASTASKGGDQ